MIGLEHYKTGILDELEKFVKLLKETVDDEPVIRNIENMRIDLNNKYDDLITQYNDGKIDNYNIIYLQ